MPSMRTPIGRHQGGRVWLTVRAADRHRRWALAGVLALALCRWASAQSFTDRLAPADPPVLSDSDRQQLEAGALVIRDLPASDPGGIGLLVMGLVDATPDRVWKVMSDCEKQHEFMPRVSHSAVRDRDGDKHTCELAIDMPYPLDPVRVETRQIVRGLPDGGHQRRWELAPGDWSYLRDDGSWSVHPYATGQRSLLVNRMDVLLKSALPVWILRAAQTREAPAVYEAIRLRVQTTTQ